MIEPDILKDYKPDKLNTSFEYANMDYGNNNNIGIFEQIQTQFNKMKYEKGIIDFELLGWLVKQYTKYEMDNHICFAGQNGVGKSLTMLNFAKSLDPNFDVEKNVIYAFNDTSDLIEKISTYEKQVICIDEANYFLGYKDFMSKKQRMLINAIEICRANRNVILLAVRDVRKLDLNYRNGKLANVIQLIDRFPDTNKPYGALLQANPFIETEDKFLISKLDSATNFSQLRFKLENPIIMPTFKGYVKVDNYLTKEDLIKYSEFKDRQMKAVNDKMVTELKTYQLLEQAKLQSRYKKMPFLNPNQSRINTQPQLQSQPSAHHHSSTHPFQSSAYPIIKQEEKDDNIE